MRPCDHRSLRFHPPEKRYLVFGGLHSLTDISFDDVWQGDIPLFWFRRESLLDHWRAANFVWKSIKRRVELLVEILNCVVDLLFLLVAFNPGSTIAVFMWEPFGWQSKCMSVGERWQWRTAKCFYVVLRIYNFIWGLGSLVWVVAELIKKKILSV